MSTIWNISVPVFILFLIIISSLICTACYNLFGTFTRSNDLMEPTSWSIELRTQNRLVRTKRYKATQNPFKMPRNKTRISNESSHTWQYQGVIRNVKGHEMSILYSLANTFRFLIFHSNKYEETNQRNSHLVICIFLSN